jgi:hypothetical protein
MDVVKEGLEVVGGAFEGGFGGKTCDLLCVKWLRDRMDTACRRLRRFDWPQDSSLPRSALARLEQRDADFEAPPRPLLLSYYAHAAHVCYL